MRNLLYIVVTTVILTACVGGGKERAVLDTAQRIINDRPDSALAMLDSLEPSSHDFSTENLRRWQLLRLMAQNKCDTVFSDDSLQKELVKYYDRYGTPNERMTAHYLLGRAYSDMGEAPIAMRCYQEATDCADTTSISCDWWNLSRIYLQLAYLYYESYMPKELSEVLRLSQSTAMHAGDTLTSILSIAKQYGVYELTGKRDSAAIVIRDAAQLYEAYGRKDLASQALSTLIEDEVDKGNLGEASHIIRCYEGYSGYFDNHHEIENGREIYYYSKGIYYLGIGCADSADFAFRKLLDKAQDMNDIHAAYLGLRKKYLQTGPKDSLVKYAMLSESSNDSLFIEHYKANVQQLQKHFNYSRHIENEQRLMRSSERKDRLLLVIIFIFIVVAIASVAFFHNQRRKREAKLKEYRENLDHLHQLKMEMAELIHNNEITAVNLSCESAMQQNDIEYIKRYTHELREKLEESRRLTLEAISSKNEEIRRLTAKHEKYDKFFENKTRDDIMKAIQKSDIVQKFNFYVTHPLHIPTIEDWDKLNQLFHEVHPNFPTTLQDTYHLSTKEYRMCQLVFAGISPKGIATLMGFNKSNASNIRKRLLAKLTGKDGKASEFDQFLLSIPLL